MPVRVVVVDDDEALRNADRRALRLESHDVEFAGDGAGALDHRRRRPRHSCGANVADGRALATV